MKKTLFVALLIAVAVTAVAVVVGSRIIREIAPPDHASAGSLQETHPSMLYGRVTTVTGAVHEGRLRFGGDQEAFWGDYFNGVKKENPWAAYVPKDQLPKIRTTRTFLGLAIGEEEQQIDLRRPFMVRLGDVSRIEAQNHDVNVTLKSGIVTKLDRLSASDFDDGVQVWDPKRGVISLDNKWVRSIEFLPAPEGGVIPQRLHGTVRTEAGAEFSGFMQWDRQESLGSETLDGRADGRDVNLRFDGIRTIVREKAGGARVTLRDGRELVVSGSRDVGPDNQGVYVDDARYGRVLVTWNALERVDLTPGGSGPSYEEFPAAPPLQGSVTTGSGKTLAGRLVFDLDESETIETLDARRDGVHYTIPFGLIRELELGDEAERAVLTLHSGERLELERTGDLDETNAGLLVLAEGGEPPVYVRFEEVRRIELARPPAMFPPIGDAPDA